MIEYLLADVDNVPRLMLWVLAWMAGLKLGDWIVWWVWSRHGYK